MSEGPGEIGAPSQDAFLRATLESTADGILVVDGSGRVTYANGVFRRMWRIPDELVGIGSDERLLEYVLDQLDDPEAFLAKVRELYASDRESFDTLRFKDGRVFERYSRSAAGAVESALPQSEQNL